MLWCSRTRLAGCSSLLWTRYVCHVVCSVLPNRPVLLEAAVIFTQCKKCIETASKARFRLLDLHSLPYALRNATGESLGQKVFGGTQSLQWQTRHVHQDMQMLQDAAAPTVDQVMDATGYLANGSLVTPVATGLIELPSAYTDGTGSVTGVDIASAYSVYFVGEDNNTTPNVMVNVSCTYYIEMQLMCSMTCGHGPGDSVPMPRQCLYCCKGMCAVIDTNPKLHRISLCDPSPRKRAPLHTGQCLTAFQLVPPHE